MKLSLLIYLAKRAKCFNWRPTWGREEQILGNPEKV